MPEELQSVKLQVGLLQQEVEVRGRQIDALLTKLDSTADKVVELTVEFNDLISTVNSTILSAVESNLDRRASICLPLASTSCFKSPT